MHVRDMILHVRNRVSLQLKLVNTITKQILDHITLRPAKGDVTNKGHFKFHVFDIVFQGKGVNPRLYNVFICERKIINDIKKRQSLDITIL